MLVKMQKLALCFLWEALNENKELPKHLRNWFDEERITNGGRFFSYLVEPEGKIQKFYSLRENPNNPEIAILEGFDIGSLEGNSAKRLPFNRPSGPQSPQLGPVIKRSYSKKTGSGPSLKILNSTIKSFMEKANSNSPWAEYFQEAVSVFNRKKLSYGGKIEEDKGKTALSLAVELIPETNQTVFLVFQDVTGRFPGDVPEYNDYLSTMIDGDEKYTTIKTAGHIAHQCPLCGRNDFKVYASACSLAGINISNIDRVGAFPGITTQNAHLSFAICANCADLLYIFKFHILEKYLAPITSQNALVLPDLDLHTEKLSRFLRNFQIYTDGLSKKDKKAINLERRQLIKVLAESRGITTIDIIWADFGQKMENLRGIITDVLPSRLKQIDNKGREFDNIKNINPFFPKHEMDSFIFDANLTFIYNLFHRPGGKKAKVANSSKKLFELKRLLAESIYKKKKIPEKRLWEEIMITARWYLTDILQSDNPVFELLNEGFSEKKNIIWLTLSGWIRHLAMTIEYFKYMEVMEMMESKRTYFPEGKVLKPYFSENSGINNDHKAFAFILGILYGRVMRIQGAKGVNVSANALTWLKRLTLTGRDMPELFIKVREKLLAYEAEKSSVIREIIHELGVLGCKLGNEIDLDQIQCCYFLLLGQSISNDIFPKENKSIEGDKK
ncbi:MAG: hypothetical protein KAU17_13155 [Spirochaetales bacterium]|nr:hypothetical protein [Spirochaetales bacterium]